MAKRKAAPAASTRTGGRAGNARKRGAAKKTAARQTAARAQRRSPGPAGGKKAAGKGGRAVKRTAKTATKAGRQRTGAVARKAATGRGTPKRSARKAATKAVKRAAPRTAARKAAPAVPRSAPTPRRSKPATVPVRKAPALNRERRVVQDDDEDIVQSTPPSSLDLDRTASSARSGRRSLRDRYDEHPEGPALTGGDVDADWESAYSVGDEAPGGDNPTPDQDLVDDIGRAVGVEYQDNEELKGADKVAKRDKNRWELDPASSDDWDDR
jgi:hypothetical protein